MGKIGLPRSWVKLLFIFPMFIYVYHRKRKKKKNLRIENREKNLKKEGSYKNVIEIKGLLVVIAPRELMLHLFLYLNKIKNKYERCNKR